MSLMERLGRLLVRKPVAWAVVSIVVALTGASAYYASRVDQDDDVLAFLPKTNPEVAQFDALNDRFGGLDVALVGIAVDDPFDGAFLTKLRDVTAELDALPSVDHALSLTNVEDFRPDPAGGIRTDSLISEIPKDAAASAALRARVMSKDQVVGNLVAADGRAITILCFGAHGADTRAFAGKVREIVERVFPDHRIYWGGAPFISTYIYDLTQKDMDRLIPWAVVVIVVIIVASFRDVFGALLALVSTGMGIIMSRGLMGVFGVDANIVLGSMPVILFAVGSAYGIHVMVRYYALARDLERREALVRAMVEVGPTVLAAGLTTVAGLLSFVMMDIAPMRSFGVFTALGILATLVLALTFVPAVLCLTGLRARRLADGRFERVLVGLVAMAHRHRRPLAMGLAGVSAAAAVTAWRVDARMENAAFFAEGSPPDRAERFLRQHFGGSNFIQVELEGDMADPDVLREVQRMGDEMALFAHVSNVNHIGKVLALANEAITDERRLPTTAEQAQYLYRVLQGNAAVRQLVTDDHRYALMHIKIDTDRFEDVEGLLGSVEQWTRTRAMQSFRVVQRNAQAPGEAARWIDELVAARIAAHLARQGARLDATRRAELDELLREPAPQADRRAVERRLAAFLRSDECILEPAQRGVAGRLAAALTALGPSPRDDAKEHAIATALERPDDDTLVEDLDLSLVRVLEEVWRQERTRVQAHHLLARLDVAVPAGAAGGRMVAGVADALLDLGLPRVLVRAEGSAATGQLRTVVNGLPVLYRGLSKSVTANQFKSLAFALGLVLLIMCALFRSVSSGLLAAVPTVVTLLVVYGIMGLRGMHLDIGTSMLASIIIGAGVDYAVHLLAAWHADAGEPLLAAATRAAARSGTAIWTNALMVSAGFFVLTLGEARPLQNVGGLTATAMLTAALATFVALPVLARKRSYRTGVPESASEPPPRPPTELAAKAPST